jgi:hypothetical protein
MEPTCFGPFRISRGADDAVCVEYATLTGSHVPGTKVHRQRLIVSLEDLKHLEEAAREARVRLEKAVARAAG